MMLSRNVIRIAKHRITGCKMLSNFRKISDDFGIEGGIMKANLEELQKQYNSVLYVASDSPTDTG